VAIVKVYTGFLDQEYQPSVLSVSFNPEVFFRPNLYDTKFAKIKANTENTMPNQKRTSLEFLFSKSKITIPNNGVENRKNKTQNSFNCQLLLDGGGQKFSTFNRNEIIDRSKITVPDDIDIKKQNFTQSTTKFLS